MSDESYCWTCGNTGEVREHPVDDLSRYIDCDCVLSVCGCGCCEYDDEDAE